MHTPWTERRVDEPIFVAPAPPPSRHLCRGASPTSNVRSPTRRTKGVGANGASGTGTNHPAHLFRVVHVVLCLEHVRVREAVGLQEVQQRPQLADVVLWGGVGGVRRGGAGRRRGVRESRGGSAARRATYAQHVQLRCKRERARAHLQRRAGDEQLAVKGPLHELLQQRNQKGGGVMGWWWAGAPSSGFRVAARGQRLLVLLAPLSPAHPHSHTTHCLAL